MKSLKTTLLIIASISFVIVIGGAVYEHVTSVPIWKQAPPYSLSMFQGQYGINPIAFWKPIHPVTVLLIVAALLANWKSTRRKYILSAFLGYVVILIITFVFFVPELLSIVQTPYDQVTDKGLATRANTWETLSLIRLAGCFAIAGTLLFSLTKGNELVPKTEAA